MNSNYKLNTSPDIIIYFFDDIYQITELYNGRLIIIDYEEQAFKITLFSKSYYNDIILYSDIFPQYCKYCLQLKNKQIVFLNKNDIRFYVIKNDELKEKSRNRYLANFSYAYEMNNKCLLLNKKKKIALYENQKIKILKNSLFKNVISINENIEKELLYYQTKQHLLILSSKTFQIQTIYEIKNQIICSFLNSINNQKNDLKLLIEKNEFNSEFLEKKYFLMGKIEYLIQISLHVFIAIYRENILILRV